MIVRANENRKQTVTNKTIRGIFISIFLQHSNVGTPLSKTQHATGIEFDPSSINISCTLRRAGKTFQMINDNLGLLGQYCTLLQGGKEWMYGTDTVRPTPGIGKHQNYRTVFLDLQGFLNLRDTDECDIQVTVGKNAFNAPLDVLNCYLDVNPAPGIGKEFGIVHIKSEIIQANTTRDSFNLGDNIIRAAFLNFEDTDVTSQIIQTLSINSDRYDQSFNLPELIMNHRLMYGKQPFDMPYYSGTPESFNDAYKPVYPQSFILFNEPEIDRCNIDISFDGNKVNASKNALMYTYFVTSQEILQRSAELESKHAKENIAKVPATL